MIHCWENIDYDYDHSGTCLLEDGHKGEHEFTPDEDISITFAGGSQ